MAITAFVELDATLEKILSEHGVELAEVLRKECDKNEVEAKLSHVNSPFEGEEGATSKDLTLAVSMLGGASAFFVACQGIANIIGALSDRDIIIDVSEVVAVCDATGKPVCDAEGKPILVRQAGKKRLGRTGHKNEKAELDINLSSGTCSISISSERREALKAE